MIIAVFYRDISRLPYEKKAFFWIVLLSALLTSAIFIESAFFGLSARATGILLPATVTFWFVYLFLVHREYSNTVFWLYIFTNHGIILADWIWVGGHFGVALSGSVFFTGILPLFSPRNTLFRVGLSSVALFFLLVLLTFLFHDQPPLNWAPVATSIDRVLESAILASGLFAFSLLVIRSLRWQSVGSNQGIEDSGQIDGASTPRQPLNQKKENQRIPIAASANEWSGSHHWEDAITNFGHIVSSGKKLYSPGTATLDGRFMDYTPARVNETGSSCCGGSVRVKREGGQSILMASSQEKSLNRESGDGRNQRPSRSPSAEKLHDLKNILSSFVTYPQLLLLDLDEKSEMRSHLEFIKECGGRANVLIHELINITKDQSDCFEAVHLNEMVNTFFSGTELTLLRLQHPAIVIESRLASLTSTMWGSRRQIHSLLLNLITNGIESMSHEGRVTVATFDVEIDSHSQEGLPVGHYLVLQVEDTGAGIPLECREQIFEPYFTTKQPGRSGTGLGMMVVRRVVSEHQGYLFLSDSQHGGTVFRIYFPAHESKDLAAKPVHKPAYEVSEM